MNSKHNKLWFSLRLVVLITYCMVWNFSPALGQTGPSTPSTEEKLPSVSDQNRADDPRYWDYFDKEQPALTPEQQEALEVYKASLEETAAKGALSLSDAMMLELLKKMLSKEPQPLTPEEQKAIEEKFDEILGSQPPVELPTEAEFGIYGTADPAEKMRPYYYEDYYKEHLTEEEYKAISDYAKQMKAHMDEMTKTLLGEGTGKITITPAPKPEVWESKDENTREESKSVVAQEATVEVHDPAVALPVPPVAAPTQPAPTQPTDIKADTATTPLTQPVTTQSSTTAQSDTPPRRWTLVSVDPPNNRGNFWITGPDGEPKLWREHDIVDRGIGGFGTGELIKSREVDIGFYIEDDTVYVIATLYNIYDDPRQTRFHETKTIAAYEFNRGPEEPTLERELNGLLYKSPPRKPTPEEIKSALQREVYSRSNSNIIAMVSSRSPVRSGRETNESADFFVEHIWEFDCENRTLIYRVTISLKIRDEHGNETIYTYEQIRAGYKISIGPAGGYSETPIPDLQTQWHVGTAQGII